MRLMATMLMAAAIAMAASGSANAGWNKFWKNVKHGNNAFKNSWNNSGFGKGVNSIGSSNCWKKAATVAFTAGIKGNDTNGKC